MAPVNVFVNKDIIIEFTNDLKIHVAVILFIKTGKTDILRQPPDRQEA